MRTWMIAAGATSLMALGGLAGALVWFSRRWIAPPRVRFEPPAEEWAEQASFSASDGVPLKGWFLPGEPERPALVLCHGYQRCMEEPFGLAVDLRERGFSVLLFDFRGCGLSGGRYTTIGQREPLDLQAAVGWLRGRVGPATPIGVHGISMGGSVAITATAATPEIGAVVADSAFAHLRGAVELRFSRLRGVTLAANMATMRIAERMCGGRVAAVRPVDAIGAIAPRPVLLIHGTEDGIVPHGHLAELRRAAGEATEVWELPGVHHAMPRFEAPDEYVERVAAFFERSLERADEPALMRYG